MGDGRFQRVMAREENRKRRSLAAEKRRQQRLFNRAKGSMEAAVAYGPGMFGGKKYMAEYKKKKKMMDRIQAGE